MHRIRASTAPQLARNITEIDNLTGPYIKTSDDLPFLQYHNLSTANRLLIFASQNSIEFLSECEVGLGDGTFKSSSPNFMQIYIIHGIYLNQVFPACFILTQHKDKATFKEALNGLKLAAAR